MSNWWGPVIFVVVLAVATGVATGMALKVTGRRPSLRGIPTARITRVVALIYLAVAGGGAVMAVLQTLMSPSVTVSMPVRQFWPSLPPTVELDGVYAQVVGGGFSNADVEVEGLSGVARIWLAAGELVLGLMTVLVAVVVVMLCTSVIRQDPFRAALNRGINLAAFGIIVGGILWQICVIVGGGMASAQVLGATGWGFDPSEVNWDDIRDVIGLPQTALGWDVDFWPLGIGLSLLAVSAVFRYGQRLQKESDSLI
jgi:hypothetical protein